MADEKTMVKKQRGGRSGAGFDVNPQYINKEGRPDAGWTWREQFIKIAEQKRERLSRREIAAEAIWGKAEAGDVQAFKEVADRMEGKPAQPHSIGGDPDNPVQLEVNVKIVSGNTDTREIPDSSTAEEI